jgi:hypothetical protein
LNKKLNDKFEEFESHFFFHFISPYACLETIRQMEKKKVVVDGAWIVPILPCLSMDENSAV